MMTSVARATGVLLILLALGCAPTASPSRGQSSAGEQVRAAPKRITAAIRGDPRTLSDSINYASSGSTVAGVSEIESLLNAGLLLVTGDGSMQPQLAEAAPTIENGRWRMLPDGRMETTWRLQPNARWHDGAPVTADDLVFSARVYMDKTQSLRPDPAFTYVEGLDAPDAQTLVARWKSTFIGADKLFVTTGTGGESRNLPMPRHLAEQAYEQDPAAFTQNPLFGQEYIGAGPFKLKEWVLGSHLVMTANDQYLLGRPKIDEIHVRFILDTNTIVSNMLADAVDVTLGRGLNPEQAILMRAQWANGTVDAGLQNTTSLRPQFINSEPSLLSTDVRFRRALMHGIDRQQIVDVFLDGFVPVANSIVTPDDPLYLQVDPYLVKYSRDNRRSAALMEEIGLARGADGIYHSASGERMAVEIRTRAHDLREKLQHVIAADLLQIGVLGEPVVVPEQRISDRIYQATYPGFYFRFGGPDIREYHSSGAPLPENNFIGPNPNRYRNAEMDGLIERYLGTIPIADRVRAYGEAMHHLTDQLVLLTLYHEPEPVLISNRLIGVGGKRGESLQTWNAPTWDVRS